MTNKRTTIYISDKLRETIQKMHINISEVCRRALEYEIYGDNPKYIEHKLQEAKKGKQEKDEEIKKLERQLEETINKKETQKKRLLSTKPEILDYRTISPKKGGDE